MEIKDMRKFNAIYDKNDVLTWQEIEDRPKHRRKQYKQFPVSRIIVNGDLPIDDEIMELSRKQYQESGELIPVLVSRQNNLVRGFEQYALAKELGIRKISCQKKSKSIPADWYSKTKVPGKSFSIATTNGELLYVDECRLNQIHRARVGAKRLHGELIILPNLTFKVIDADGKYILGSDDMAFDLERILHKIQSKLHYPADEVVQQDDGGNNYGSPDCILVATSGKEIPIKKSEFKKFMRLERICKKYKFTLIITDDFMFTLKDEVGKIALNISLLGLEKVIDRFLEYNCVHSIRKNHAKMKHIANEALRELGV